MDLRQRLLESPLSRVQIVAIAIGAALNTLDSFDILSITFAAPGIAHEWGVERTALGIVFSAGMAGMALGAATLSGLGDVLGRRPALLGFLAVITVGMLATAAAPGVAALVACRFVTGLGIGGLIALINVLVSEQANARRRHLAVAVATTGFSLGGLVGGLVAGRLLLHYDWRSIFVFGGAASAIAFVVALAYVPESIEFLISRPRADSLSRVNAILARMGHAPVAQLPRPLEIVKVPASRLFRGDLIGLVAALVAAYFFLVTAFYFVAAWAPQIARDLGGAPADVANFSALISASGVAGTIVFGLVAGAVGLGRASLVTVAVSALALAALGLPNALPSFALAAAAAGFFVFASFTGIYALIVQSFATEVRATACGLIVGVGRIGAVISPLLVGGLLGAGFNFAFVCGLMALFALIAAAAIASLQILRSRAGAAPALAPV